MRNSETEIDEAGVRHPTESDPPMLEAAPPSGTGAARRLEARAHRAMYLGAQLIRGRPVGVYIGRLRQWDRLDAQSHAEMARRRLAGMLRHARQRVPLYRSGAWASRLGEDASVLERWPTLERHELLERPEQLIAEGIPGVTLYTRRSSASTGTPVKVAWSLGAIGWSWAAEYHPMLWHGLEIGVRTLRMWGAAGALENFVLNRHFVPAHALSAARLEEALRYVQNRRPELIWGTPSAVHELARHVARTRGRSETPRVRYAKIGGEQVYAFQREEISRYLGARVIESYGCTEMGPIAAECPAGSLHVLAATVHIEIFRDGEPVPPGEVGEIVATTLVNRGMPLVRCRIGDMASLSPRPCACGLPQPVLENLRGRAADMVLRPDGTLVHGSILGGALQRYAGKAPLGQAQKVLFEQLDRHNWRVQIQSPMRDQHEALDRQVSALLRETFGEGCSAETLIVPEIPRERSGKFRYYKALGAVHARRASTDGQGESDRR